MYRTKIGSAFRIVIMAVSCLLTVNPLHAQQDSDKITSTVKTTDSLFWNAYNNCDNVTIRTLLSPDLEFYHDKGGITLGADSLAASLQRNLCSTPGYHLRREEVPGTVHTFLMSKDNIVYGALVTGEHYFYITNEGKKEFRDGWAKFTTLWLLQDGTWKISRVLSYDHHPAPYVNERKEVHLTNAQLQSLRGTYVGPQAGRLIVDVQQGALGWTHDGNRTILHPSASRQFFVKERDLTFEFQGSGNGVTAMIVRENGNIVETLTPVK